MKKPKKILLIPNYLGGGFGHIGRCLSIADYAKTKGMDCGFVISGAHEQIVRKEGYKTYLPVTVSPKSSGREGPPYLYIPDMSYQVVRDGFNCPAKVETSLRELLVIAERFKPDLLIGDGHVLTGMLGSLIGVPVVQIVKSAVHPLAQPMVFWEDKPEGLNLPDPRPVFNPVLRKHRLPEINKAEGLLFGDLLALPSIPELDPMPKLPENTYYTGSIIRNHSNHSQNNSLDSIPRDKPIIYITIGGAAGNYAQKSYFKIFVDAFKRTNFRVVISSGGKTVPQQDNSSPNNIQFVPWVDTGAMLSLSSLVIFHGGYTRMEIIRAGLPSIVIPFHSEQEYYGRILERAGVARLVSGSEEPYKHISMSWKGGRSWWQGKKQFSIHARKTVTLLPQVLQKTATEVMADKSMSDNLRSLQAELSKYKGPQTLFELAENNIGTIFKESEEL